MESAPVQSIRTQQIVWASFDYRIDISFYGKFRDSIERLSSGRKRDAAMASPGGIDFRLLKDLRGASRGPPHPAR
jgi:hypothetical protein